MDDNINNLISPTPTYLNSTNKNGFSLVKIIFILILFIYGVRAIPYYWAPVSFDPDPFYLMNAINMPFHEFGHFFLIFLGFNQYLIFWGGTIFQFLIPFIIFLYFLKRKQIYNCAVILFWISECFFNTSYYIKDSRALILPLLIPGGTHDWWYILGQSNLLKYDLIIGQIILIIGIILFAVSIILGLIFSKKTNFETEY